MHFLKKSVTYHLSPIISEAGFTLIELLIVITLMGIFVGGGIAGYRTFNTRQIVVTTGKELLVNLRQAQSKMNSGIKTTASCSGSRLIGYKLRSTAVTQYEIVETYSTNCNAGSADAIIKTVRLPSGLAFQSTFSITFLGLSGGATLSAASPQTLRLCNNSCGAGALSYLIAVNQAGLIEDQGVQ